MPKLDHSIFIKGSSAKYNGNKGNLLLSADGLQFVPDNGGPELQIPIENILDASLEGVVRKRVCVVINGSADRPLFSVSDLDGWHYSISLAAGIYRRIVTGKNGFQKATKNKPSSPQAKSSQTSPNSFTKNVPASPKPAQSSSSTVKTASHQIRAPSVTITQTKPPSQKTSWSHSKTAVSATYTGSWPSGQDYEQSFQMMKLSISKKIGEVDKWEAVKNPKTPGWYVFASGNYGSIYKIKDENGRYFALKCFTRKSGDINDRYVKISDYLASHSKGINFLAHFRYYQEGIKTRKSQTYMFPLLRMEWMDGVTLNKYLNAHINESKVLKKISDELIVEIKKLQKSGISHGDLAGDNIIITDTGEVKLVDYDGMYIPDFKGQKSTEMGHADFQHPKRTGETFSEKLDNFSALVIHLSLTALSLKPDLWDKYNGDDPDCLILRKKDFQDLGNSDIFKELMKIRNKKVRKMCILLKEYLSKDALWDGASPNVLSSL